MEYLQQDTVFVPYFSTINIKYKYDIHLDGNLFMFSTPVIQTRTLEFRVTSAWEKMNKLFILHFHTVLRTGN